MNAAASSAGITLPATALHRIRGPSVIHASPLRPAITVSAACGIPYGRPLNGRHFQSDESVRQQAVTASLPVALRG
jgi:hypothetical protein